MFTIEHVHIDNPEPEDDYFLTSLFFSTGSVQEFWKKKRMKKIEKKIRKFPPEDIAGGEPAHPLN